MATVSVVTGGATVSAALWVVPLYVPEIVTEVDVLTAEVVTVKLALVAPAATVTVDGNEPTDGYCSRASPPRLPTVLAAQRHGPGRGLDLPLHWRIQSE